MADDDPISRRARECAELLEAIVARVPPPRGRPEAALRAANQKFIRRFHAIERKLAARGLSPTESDLAEMDCLWENVKREEKGSPRS